MRVAGVFIALTIVAAVAVYGFDAALADAGDRDVIAGESFTPQVDTAVALDRSNLGDTVYYNNSVDVVDENGDQSFEGEDYIWYEKNGTIEALSGGNLDGDASATIDYSYRETTTEQRELTALLSQIPKSVALILPLGFALAAFAALRGS